MKKTDFLRFLSAFELSNTKISKILDIMAEDFSFEKFVNEDELEKVLHEDYFTIVKKANEKFLTAYIEKLNALDIKIITRADENFPEKLLHVDDPPYYIFYKGDLSLLNDKCVAIVGTRMPSSYGITVTERFAKELALAGGVIVSGLAYGVDSIAHRKALEENGKTVAVLAGGFNNIYPQENYSLFCEIATKGLVLTEHRPDVKSVKYLFPQRNRIVAGISDALLITEAGAKSGTTITKDFALDYGVPIYAVPGNITSTKSEGTNALIASMQGICAIDPQSIIDDLGLVKKKKVSQQLSIDEALIVDKLKDACSDIDEIQLKTKLNINKLNSLLTTLEIKGIIKRLPGGLYSLS